jgi:GH24 family phage-related lysozyme (muramidase)
MSSDNLVSFLKKEEGWRDKAYQDSGGVWTIGYGRTKNADGSKVKAGQLTNKEAEDTWIVNRANEDYTATKNYLDSKGYTYSEGQLNSLSSFRYNGGQGMLQKLTGDGTRDWDTISSKMPQYNKVNKNGKMVPIKGLTNRRNAELGLWGEYSNSSPAVNVPALSPSNLTNNTSLRPEIRPADLVTTGTTSPTEYKVPTTVPPVTYTTPNTSIDAAVREANQPVPQVANNAPVAPVVVPQVQPQVQPQAVPQQVAIDRAVSEALQNTTGFPDFTMPDIPLYNQGTTEVPQVMNYNDGTEGVSWLDSLKGMFAGGSDTLPGAEYRKTAVDARAEAFANQPAAVPAVDSRFDNVAVPGLDDTPRGSESMPSYTPPLPPEGRNMAVAAGDFGDRDRIPASYLQLPSVKEAMEDNAPGTYFRDGQKVKYVQTGDTVRGPRLMTYAEAWAIVNTPESSEESILKAKKRISGNFEVISEDQGPMKPIEARRVLSDPNASSSDTIEAETVFGKHQYSGRGEVGMPVPTVVDPTSEPTVDDQKAARTNTVDLPNGVKATVNEDGSGEDSQGNTVFVDADNNKAKINDKLVDTSGISGVLKNLFGLEMRDLKKALGFYLMSRATGASHAGSMRWAGGIALKQASARTETEKKTALKQAKDKKTIAALKDAGYSDAMARSYVETGVDKLLEKPETFTPYKTGQEVTLGITGVPGLENVSGYQMDYGKANGGKVNLFRVPTGKPGEFQTLTEDQLRAYVDRTSNGEGSVDPFDADRDTSAGRQAAASKFVTSLGPAAKDIFAGQDDKVKAELPLALSSVTQFMQNEMGYNFNDPGIQASSRVVIMSAIENMRDDLASGRVKDVDNAAPYVKQAILTSAALGPGQMFLTANGKQQVDATKVNVLWKRLEDINSDPGSIKTNFKKLHQTYIKHKGEGSLPSVKLNKRTENEFYVWAREILSDKEKTNAILGG